MAKSPASINLLQKKRATGDIILEWALTTGRFIIILTETIALAAFVYRFTLDRQIIDLHDKIKQKQAIVDYYKDNETQYRQLQAKLNTLASLNSQTTQTPTLVSDMVQLATGKVILQNLTVTPTHVQITASTTTIGLMNSYVNSLKDYQGVLGVDVSQVENKPDTGLITLTIDVTIGPKRGGANAG